MIPIDGPHAFARPLADTAGTAAVDPIVVMRCHACERPLRVIPDLPINLLELNSGDDAAGKPGAVQFAPEVSDALHMI